MPPPFFGDLAKEAGGPERAQSRRFAFWSDLKYAAAALDPLHLDHPARWLRRGRPRDVALAHRRGAASPRAGCSTLCAMAALELAICAFADAHIELVRHLYVFHAMIDLVLVATVVWTVQTLATRRRRA